MTRGLLLVTLAVVSVLAAGCGLYGDEPPSSEERPAQSPSGTASAAGLLDPDGNVVLYVSNQSFEIDPVDIVIEIDGREVVNDDFEVNGQHTWVRYRLQVPDGRHTLTARSVRGQAELRESFVVSGKHWAVLNYWYASEAHASPPEPHHFELDVFDKPVVFA